MPGKTPDEPEELDSRRDIRTAPRASGGKARKTGRRAGGPRAPAVRNDLERRPIEWLDASDHAFGAAGMDKFLYYLVTAVESALSVVGIRSVYEQPRYTVVERLDRGVEVRSYDGRIAVETDAHGAMDGQAFGRLFRYITGANTGSARIAMTAPVETDGSLIAMTVPVEQGAGGTMRFYLPRKVSEAGAPEPTEAGVRLVRVPPERMAVLRFSGRASPAIRRDQARILEDVLRAGARPWMGEPIFLGYDPPFSVPFLRRNEVALRLPIP